MTSYDEHLISMAGGDGDVLGDIEARIRACKSYNFGLRHADRLAHEDAPALLALVREQQARIGRVAELHAPIAESDDDEPYCRHCKQAPYGHAPYPCPTIAALTATEGA